MLTNLDYILNELDKTVDASLTNNEEERSDDLKDDLELLNLLKGYLVQCADKILNDPNELVKEVLKNRDEEIKKLRDEINELKDMINQLVLSPYYYPRHITDYPSTFNSPFTGTGTWTNSTPPANYIYTANKDD